VVYASGTLSLTVAGGLITGSGTVKVTQNTTGTDFTAGSISASGVTVSSIPTIAAGAKTFSGTGLNLTIANFVKLSGDFGFEKVGTEVRVAVTGASASLEAGSAVSVSATGASIGLVLSDAGQVVYASGTLSLTVAGGLITGSGTVKVTQNTTSTAFTAGSISASGVTVSSIPTIAAGAKTFSGTGLNLTIADFVKLSGTSALRRWGRKSGWR